MHKPHAMYKPCAIFTSNALYFLDIAWLCWFCWHFVNIDLYFVIDKRCKIQLEFRANYWNTKMAIILKQDQIGHIFIWTLLFVFVSIWSRSHMLWYTLMYRVSYLNLCMQLSSKPFIILNKTYFWRDYYHKISFSKQDKSHSNYLLNYLLKMNNLKV